MEEEGKRKRLGYLSGEGPRSSKTWDRHHSGGMKNVLGRGLHLIGNGPMGKERKLVSNGGKNLQWGGGGWLILRKGGERVRTFGRSNSDR